MNPSKPLLTLDCTPLRQRFLVRAVQAPPRAPEWAQWLEEIGFMPGEQVELLARGAFGDGFDRARRACGARADRCTHSFIRNLPVACSIKRTRARRASSCGCDAASSE